MKRHPRVVAIRWQQAGDGDDVRQMERPMRDGIDPLREARSLAQRSAIPRGTTVYYYEIKELAGAKVVAADGSEVHVDYVLMQLLLGKFTWEHGR